MTRFSIEEIRNRVERGIEDHGLRPFARLIGVPVGVARSVMEGRDISASNLLVLAEKLGLALSFTDQLAPAKTDFSLETIPHHGLAKCSVRGWGKDQPNLSPLPRPEFINDPDAFYVSAVGKSMTQEGIEPGDFCLVSPAQDIKEGDRIWLKDRSGLTSIKRLEKMTGDRLALRGWMPPEDGKQTNFHDEVKSTFIQQAHPVVAVFRGKPGSDRATFIPDPLGDEPQIVTGVDLEEFAMIRLHKVQLAAGAGRQSWDDGPTTAIALPKPWLRQRGISPSAASLVWVKGDSMEPTLKSGAMVMINHNRRDPGARRIYAFRQGDDLRVKRLEWLTPEQLLISSDNPAHKAELLTQPDMDDLEIIGEVVWSGANVG